VKTIGIIGGMSWESTAHYYAAINRETARLRGGLHSAPMLIQSLDFAPIAKMQSDGRWEEAGAVLAQSARTLEAAGAEIIILATNTMHIVADSITAAISADFIHIADPTAEALIADGAQTVGLLGTRFTMEMDFYKNGLKARGLIPLTPEIGQTDLSAIIYDELCRGIVTEASRQTYVAAIERLAANGAEAIILGCTELNMLIDDDASPLPVYDTTDLHAKAAVAAALTK
jgi:aspartate racemase